jgi:hypothetical protein
MSVGKQFGNDRVCFIACDEVTIKSGGCNCLNKTIEMLNTNEDE